jgi:hypothetical protein
VIVLRAVRVEDSGAETELGEVRLTEVGAVFAHSATPEGHGVIADLRERLRCAAPEAVKQSRLSAARFETPSPYGALGRERRGR